MSVAAAFLLALLTYALVMKEETLRDHRLLCFLVLSVRQGAILTNLYVTRLPGYAGDAKRFYRAATNGIDWDSLVGTGSSFYSNFLASVFKVTGPSQEMAFETSFLAFGLLLIALGRLLRLFGYSERTGLVVLLVGLSPSATCYASSILREGWQELFLLLACYFTVKLRHKFSVRTLLFLGASLLLLGCLQKGLALFALIYGVLAFFYLTRRGQARGPMLLLAIVAIFLGGYFKLLGASELELETSSNVVAAFTEGEIVEFAVDYRGSLNEARANYADHLELDTATGLLWAFPQLVFYYWSCPLPWQAEESIDLIAMAEIWIRTVLFFYGVVGFQKAKSEEREALSFLGMMFIILEVMFAAGTGNWGTAARHRTVGLPLLCVLSMAGLVKKRGQFGTDDDRVVSTKPEKLSKREQIRRRRRRQGQT
jgi:hypothetical protein